MSFQCVLVTPEQQVLDEQVAQAILPAHDNDRRDLDDSTLFDIVGSKYSPAFLARRRYYQRR